MEYSQIRVETRGPVALLTLDRPDKLNAWTPRMAEELAHAIAAANEDRDLGAIVMTGEGRGFCAGADVDADAVFKTRVDGKDPDNDTAGGSGGVPASVDWVSLARPSKPLIAGNPARQLRMTKELLTENACTTDLDRAQKLETEALRICWTTPEHHEAVGAFLAKRKPDFRKVAP